MSTIEAILAGSKGLKGHAKLILRKSDHTYFTENYCYTLYIYIDKKFNESTTEYSLCSLTLNEYHVLLYKIFGIDSFSHKTVFLCLVELPGKKIIPLSVSCLYYFIPLLPVQPLLKYSGGLDG